MLLNPAAIDAILIGPDGTENSVVVLLQGGALGLEVLCTGPGHTEVVAGELRRLLGSAEMNMILVYDSWIDPSAVTLISIARESRYLEPEDNKFYVYLNIGSVSVSSPPYTTLEEAEAERDRLVLEVNRARSI